MKNGYNSGTILKSMLSKHSFTHYNNQFKIGYSLYEISGYILAKNRLFQKKLVNNFCQLTAYNGTILIYKSVILSRFIRILSVKVAKITFMATENIYH